MIREWRWWLRTGACIGVLLVALSGCAYHGVAGDGCILCDWAPPHARRTVLTEPLVISVGTAIVAPAIAPVARFNGLAVVALSGDVRHLQGEIFQALQIGCGITQVDAVDERQWSSATTPTHDYRVKVSASGSSWRYGVSLVSVSAMLSQNTLTTSQRREYRFVKNGSGIAYYGGGYDYYGRPRYTGVHRSYEEALRVALRGAMRNLCGHALPGARSGGGTIAPQVNSMACLPPTCDESEQTISLSGTWGGPGIYSHWPTRGHVRQKDERHHRRHKREHRASPPRAPVYKGR